MDKKASLTDRLTEFVSSPNGKAITVGIIIILALIAFYMIYAFSAPTTPETSLPQRISDAKTDKTKSNLTDEEKAEMERFEVYQGKDPFEPLIDMQAETTTDTVVDGEGTVVDGVTDGTGETVTPSPVTEPVAQQISLLDIFYEQDILYANIQVNETTYKVKEGDLFADNYKVISLAPSSATILYGDDSLVLNLGESITK